MSSLSQIYRQIEALDQLRVLDASDQQLRHLHFQKVSRKSAQLLVIDLKLDAEHCWRVWADLKNGWEAEECHAVKHNELLLFERVSVLSGLWLH